MDFVHDGCRGAGLEARAGHDDVEEIAAQADAGLLPGGDCQEGTEQLGKVCHIGSRLAGRACSL
ncbi:hypothetical protein ACFU9F_03665 [Streptomyces zhihengii]|uniref:hypothetical protein n=1 Tax=Streptomyces zhihengii TaxID=1818004 RepID=UPI003683AF38